MLFLVLKYLHIGNTGIIGAFSNTCLLTHNPQGQWAICNKAQLALEVPLIDQGL